MDRIKVSKRISYFLRHHPEKAGIKLDRQGWADVGQLLTGLDTSGISIGLEELKELVAKDDKGRFVFSEDGRAIRATHGHSVAVDLNLESQEPPAVLYHGTAERFLQSIMEFGILPGSRQMVHLSPNPGIAETVGRRHGRPVVLEVAAGAMWQEGCKFYDADGQTWLTDRVPVKYIRGQRSASRMA